MQFRLKDFVYKSRILLTAIAVLTASLISAIPPVNAVPLYAQFSHSDSLQPVPAEYCPGSHIDLKKFSEKDSITWARVPPRLAGKWKLARKTNAISHAYDNNNKHFAELPPLKSYSSEMIIGLQEAENKTVWDSENINQTKTAKFTKTEIIRRWGLNYGSDTSMSLIEERFSFDLANDHITARNVYLSETIVNFDLKSDDELQVSVDVKWFTPDGQALAETHSQPVYKREKQFKNVDSLSGVNVKAAFEERNAKARQQTKGHS